MTLLRAAIVASFGAFQRARLLPASEHSDWHTIVIEMFCRDGEKLVAALFSPTFAGEDVAKSGARQHFGPKGTKQLIFLHELRTIVYSAQIQTTLLGVSYEAESIRGLHSTTNRQNRIWFLLFLPRGSHMHASYRLT